MDSDDQYDEEELHSFLLTEIRSNLNLDSETLEESWKSFRSISVKYILEVRIQNYSMILLIIYFHSLKKGDKMDWLACALYISCRKCSTQTGRGQARIEGNMVSLTRILRSCNIRLL